MATQAIQQPAVPFQERIAAQFRGLNPNDPASWPLVPKLALCAGVAAAIVAALWFVWLTDSATELDTEQQKEVALRTEYQKKVAQAVNLDALRKQREQVQQYVTQLEKQLPSKAEMDALLSDINQAGLGRSLSFELFRPGSVSVKEYYAELPITLKVTGRFHDIGSFASDIAHLSRIVTMHNLDMTAGRDETITLDATARTYRYLDKDEVDAQRKATKGGNK
ncbi:type 4a pilus biogenesis protein PilO [Ramlibacter pallidus]|uniref:Type 4a pilus biogenesis protein PilO n=1 Tax=Ramlibacter pallidus TaxID=2780087 RepID=A0ABR9RYN2_9BURK|nr:type 4a pilus biogenesis protein PilO [Ramlibacter pallidus]MBE7366353.1 type 4a pilus biogenesis protein PilO [Ramlibacter pallidus]